MMPALQTPVNFSDPGRPLYQLPADLCLLKTP